MSDEGPESRTGHANQFGFAGSAQTCSSLSCDKHPHSETMYIFI